MPEAFDNVQKLLKQLPGLGFRSAERIALHLLIERPEKLEPLINALREAARVLRRCNVCGNLSENETCPICADPGRRRSLVCVIEQVPDLMSFERSGAYRGVYHVLHGKLSPIKGIGPENLNLEALRSRVTAGEVEELILALSNDIEGEATCHYVQETILAGTAVRVSRIGFGLPSGSGITYADPATLKNALEGRREYQ